MGIRSTEFGAVLIEQKVRLGNERVFPDRFPEQGGALVGTPAFSDSAGTIKGTDQVGYTVCVNGDLAAVGVPFSDYDATATNPLVDAGAVYMYTRQDSATWAFAYRIAPPTGLNRAANQRYGTALSLNQGILAVGVSLQNYDANLVTPANPLTNAGAVFVYEVTNTAAVLKQKLVPVGTNARNTSDQFGYSVAVLGDAIAVGAPVHGYDELGSANNVLSNSGAVFVYFRNSDTKLWVQAQKVIAQGNSRNSGDVFGTSTASDGKTLVVGAPAYDYSNTPGLGYLQDAGAAYVFYWNAPSNSWVYEGIILPNARVAGDRFGDRVAVMGDIIVVSSNINAVGQVRSYRRTTVGTFVEETALVPQTRTVAAGQARFGYSLSLTATTLVVGAMGQNLSNNGSSSSPVANVGNVYSYGRGAGGWVLQQDFSNPLYPQNQAGVGGAVSFGISVSATDDLLVVGAHTDSTDQNNTNAGSNTGAAYLYSRSGATWTFVQKIVGWGHDRNANDNFGTTMAYNNGTLVVSAPLHSYDVIGNNYIVNAGAIYVYGWDGTALAYQQKITPTGVNARIASDRFGTSLAIDGDTIVAGSVYHSYNVNGGGAGANAGGLWVFKRINTVWTQTQKLQPTSPNGFQTGNQFGTQVVIQGNTIAASSPYHAPDAAGGNALSNAGAVFVFEANGAGQFIQTAKLVAQGPGGRAANDYFGSSLDLRDGLVIAGSTQHTLDFDGANPLSLAGAAWLYSRNADTGVWNFVTKFSGWGQDRNTNDYMGIAMAASADTVAVGVSNHAYDASSRNYFEMAGAVMVYTWDGTKWNFQAKLTSEGNRQTYGRFGRSLALEGDTLVVGAPGEEIPAPNNYGVNHNYFGNGAVYVFARNFGVWTRQARLLPQGTNANYNNSLRVGNQPGSRYSHARFGWSVSLSGNQLLVGQPWSSWDQTGANVIDFAGAAYVFNRNTTTLVWSQEARLTSNMISPDRASYDLFGWSVSIREGIAVIGAPLQDLDQDATNTLSDAGAAYVFRRDPAGDAGFTWSGEQKIIGWGQDRNTSDTLGFSIAGHNGTLVVGGPNHSYNATGGDYKASAGAVFVWVATPTGWQFQQKLFATGTNNRSANDRFGNAVAIYGDTLVAASSGFRYINDGTLVGFNVGAAFVFTRTDGKWTQTQRLEYTAYSRSDFINNGRAPGYGNSLAIDHDTIAVGAPTATYDATGAGTLLANAGQVYMYRNTAGPFTLEQVLVAKTRKTSEQFGQQLDVRDNLLLVGSPVSYTDTSDSLGVSGTATGMGGVWVFNRTGTVWSYSQKLSSAPTDRQDGDQMGYSVSSDGRTLVVGAPYSDYDNGIAENTFTDAGAAYVYALIGGSWRFESRLVAQGVNARNTSANFGFSVSVSNDTIAVGAPYSQTDAAGANALGQAGAAFVYRAAGSAIVRKTKRRQTFAGTGVNQSFLVPDGVTNLNVMMWGAGGGSANNYSGIGGPGAFARAMVPVTPGETLTLLVGKGGATGIIAGAGGGRSELLRGTTTLIVAGAGGGSGNSGSNPNGMPGMGGAGGVLVGESPLDADVLGGAGRGGSQTAGGAAGYTTSVFVGSPGARGKGGDGYTPATGSILTALGGWPGGGKGTGATNYTWHSAGGGDGYYGGGAASSPANIASTTTSSGGGGGSSYLSPDVTGYAIQSTNSTAPELKRLINITTATNVGSGVTGAAGTDGFIVVEWDELYSPRVWSQEARIVPTGTNARAAADQFGYAVSVDANTLIVGAPGHDYDATGATAISNAGAAWIYERTDTTWSQSAKLVGYGANGRIAGDQFGLSVSASGDVVAVGAPTHGYDETGTNLLANAGATFAYRKIGSTWTPLNKIVAWGRDVDTSNNSGWAMSGDSTYLAVGAPGHDYDLENTNWFNDAGSVYLWNWNGSLWTLEQRLIAPAAFRNSLARFGFALSMKDDTLVVGAPGATSAGKLNVGAAFVYRRTNLVAGKPWVLEGTLETPTANAVTGSQFGTSVNYYKNTVAVGAPGSQITTGVTDGAGGAAFVFARTDTTWAFQARLVPTGTNASVASDTFGASVSQYDDMLVVGAPAQSFDQDGRNTASAAGAAWVFMRKDGTWSQTQKLIAWGHDRNESDRHSKVLVGNGNTLAVSAPGHSYNDQGNEYLGAAGAVYVWVYEGNPATWRLQQKITPTGVNARNTNEQFGSALALNGDLLVVGSNLHAYDAVGGAALAGAGAVWVFRRKPGEVGSRVWTQEAKLVATGLNTRVQTNEFFGFSVACEDSTGQIIVGAPQQSYDATGANLMTSAGAAFYFVFDGTKWTQQQRISGGVINRGSTGTNGRAASDQFGFSVDVRGDILVIGSPYHDYDQNGRNILTDAGAVYLYAKNNGTGLWDQKQKLVGWGQDRQSNDQYGWAVAGDGTYLAVGAPQHAYDSKGDFYAPSAGAVYLWSFSDGVWSFQQKITARDGADNGNQRMINDQFGYSLSMSEGYLAVGAPGQGYDAAGTNLLTNAGATYVFKRVSGLWTFSQKLVGVGTNGRIAGDQFGLNLAMDQDTLAIAAPLHDWDEAGANTVADAGAVFVFRRDAQDVWNLERKLVGQGTNGRLAGDQFGFSLALKSNLLVVGSPYQDSDQAGANSLTDAGAAWVFRRVSTTWNFEDKISPTGLERRSGDRLSASVAVSDNVMVVGAPAHTYDRYNRASTVGAGAAYVFVWNGTQWIYDSKITPKGVNSRNINDAFGFSVGVWNGYIAVGAPNQDWDADGANVLVDAGAIWIFRQQPVTKFWSQMTKLVPTGTNARVAGDAFGTNMMFNNGWLIAGVGNHAYDADGAAQLANAGAVFAFKLATLPNNSVEWQQQAKLIPTGTNARNAGDRFGSSISLDTAALLVGAPGHQYPADAYAGTDPAYELPQVGAGAAFLFKLVDNAWTQSNKITAFESTRRVNDRFGTAVSATADALVVSAVGHGLDRTGNNLIPNAGALYTYNRRTIARNNFLRLNGSTDYADISTVMPALHNRPYTFGGWFRTNTYSDTIQYLWSMVGATGTTPASYHNLYVQYGILSYTNQLTSAGIPIMRIADNTWHHLAVTLDTTGKATVYIDGTPVGAVSATYASIVPKNTYQMLLGASIATAKDGKLLTAGSFFNGDISDFAVWNSPLLPAEVASIAQGTALPTAVQPIALVGYWITN